MSESLEPVHVPQARLKTEPNVLDFGEINNAAEIKNRGQAVLTITNEGDRVLVGRINIQVGWIDVIPKDFRLSPGQSSALLDTAMMIG